MEVREGGKVAFNGRWGRRDSVQVYVAVFSDESLEILWDMRYGYVC